MDPQTPTTMPMTPAPVPQKKDKSKILIIIVSVLAVLLLIGLVVVYINANSQAKQKNTTITQQQSKIDQQSAEIDKLKQGIDDTKVIIPELGLQFPKTPDNLNVVYIVDQKDPSKSGLFLTSKTLMIAQLNASRLVPPPQKNACGAAESPAGTISVYKPDGTINGQKVSTLQNAELRKIGDNYYYYQPAPAVCSVNTDVQAEQKKATTQAQSFFKSLELKKEN